MSSTPDTSRPVAEKPPLVRLAKGQEVSLGCGTLILIALIVGLFAPSGIGDLKREVHELRSQVGELTKAVTAQTREVKALQDQLAKPKGKE